MLNSNINKELADVSYFFKYDSIFNKYYFDVNTFLNFQGRIAEKFPNPREVEIDMVDSFILHIIEECEEYLIECNNHRKKESIEEYIDCVMYVFSFLYSLIKRYGGTENFNLINKVLIEKDKYMEIHEKEPNSNKISLLNIITTSFIWNIRRLYPERKYHKPYNKFKTIDEWSNRAKKVVDYTMDCINQIINELVYEASLAGIDLYELSNMMIKKQNYILFEL